LPLGRAYAEYFGGGIAVQSMFGWGTDVYLTLQGIGKVEETKNAPSGLEEVQAHMKDGNSRHDKE